MQKPLEKKVTGENYVWYNSVRAVTCNASCSFIFFVYIFIHISANMSRIGLTFSQMILHTSTSKMMNNLPFLLVVLHKPTLWPSTFKWWYSVIDIHDRDSIHFKTFVFLAVYCSFWTSLSNRDLKVKKEKKKLIESPQC